MNAIRELAGVVLLLLAVPGIAAAQALANLTLLRVQYNTRKMSAPPQGELVAQVEVLDKQIAESALSGQNGELRRLFAKGMTLLAGKSWTDELDFATSLVLRTDRIVADSTKPFTVRLEQIYSPSIALQRRLSARVALRQSGGAAGSSTATPEPVVKGLGTLEGVSRDLRESPFPIEADLSGLPDGSYQLSVDVLDQSRSLGTATLAIRLHNGLDAVVTKLEKTAARLTGPARDEVLFPVDRIRVQPRAFPLVIALHGLSQTEDSFFDAYGKTLPKLAEQRGYIVAAPLGYRVDGFYGWGMAAPPEDVVARRRQELSEQDVMEVLKQVRTLYNVDETRIYLMGHSMGARSVRGGSRRSTRISGPHSVRSPASAHRRRPAREAHPAVCRPRRRGSDGQRAGFACDGR